MGNRVEGTTKVENPTSTWLRLSNERYRSSSVISIWDSQECSFLKPCWLLDNRWCLSRYLSTWEHMKCPRSLHTAHVRDTGRQLDASCTFPFLNTGDPNALDQSSGMHPDSKDWLNRADRGGANSSATSLRTLFGLEWGPVLKLSLVWVSVEASWLRLLEQQRGLYGDGSGPSRVCRTCPR